MSNRLLEAPVTSFRVPDSLIAGAPAEARGLARDEVRMLVAQPDGLRHVLFRDLPEVLDAGDLLVFNTSATLAAAVDGRMEGRDVVVHFSTPLGGQTWAIELRTLEGSRELLEDAQGIVLELPGDASATILSAHPDPSHSASRLWTAEIETDGVMEDYLAAHGRPITYEYQRKRWPLSTYQSVFARDPGSAEMPSAGRPFSQALVTRLVTAGVNLAPVLLHCGVSSLEAGELPHSERFRVPRSTAWLVNQTRAAGGRVIAVGTSVTRALETMAGADGIVSKGQGMTDLVLGPARRVRVVDGLVTGWHDPGASHLLLLEAVAPPALVQRAYEAALEARYLWHELGDTCLFLPA